jgi:hypothetical protein
MMWLSDPENEFKPGTEIEIVRKGQGSISKRGKRPLGIQRRRWKDTVRIDFMEIG